MQAHAAAICGFAALSAVLAALGCSSDSDDGGDAQTRPGEVAFQSGELTLHGTFAYPDGTSGPVPGVVLVHGSGPNTRHELLPGQLGMSFGFNVAVFDDISAGLVAAGIAVLRYDKRTCGVQHGCYLGEDAPVDATLEDFIADARAAGKFLSRSAGVDPARIVIAGHSEGGALTPQLADHFAGAALIAGPFRPIDLVGQQVERLTALLTEAGKSAEEIGAALGPLADLPQQLMALRAGEPTADVIAGMSRAYWESLIRVQDWNAEHASEVAVPVLALGGDYDWNVPVSELELWRQHLPAMSSIEALPCVTHALNCISQPDYHLIQPEDIGRAVAPEVITALSGFVLAVPARNSEHGLR